MMLPARCLTVCTLLILTMVASAHSLEDSLLSWNHLPPVSTVTTNPLTLYSEAAVFTAPHSSALANWDTFGYVAPNQTPLYCYRLPVRQCSPSHETSGNTRSEGSLPPSHTSDASKHNHGNSRLPFYSGAGDGSDNPDDRGTVCYCTQCKQKPVISNHHLCLTCLNKQELHKLISCTDCGQCKDCRIFGGAWTCYGCVYPAADSTHDVPSRAPPTEVRQDLPPLTVDDQWIPAGAQATTVGELIHELRQLSERYFEDYAFILTQRVTHQIRGERWPIRIRIDTASQTVMRDYLRDWLRLNPDLLLSELKSALKRHMLRLFGQRPSGCCVML